MSEPKPFDESWVLALVGWIVGGMVAGIGSAMAWFVGSKRRMYARLGFVETDMKDMKELFAKHTIELAVIQTNQEHMTQRLNEIRECTEDTSNKIDTLSKTLTDVLLAMKKS